MVLRVVMIPPNRQQALRVEQDSTCDEVDTELGRVERNMHKRLPGSNIDDVAGNLRGYNNNTCTVLWIIHII